MADFLYNRRDRIVAIMIVIVLVFGTIFMKKLIGKGLGNIFMV